MHFFAIKNQEKLKRKKEQQKTNKLQISLIADTERHFPGYLLILVLRYIHKYRAARKEHINNFL